MSVITRFAPSPTGYLHVGNIRTALINWLYARANNGKFILRIDDTDKDRSKSEYTDAIMRDLEWLGLHWDEIHYQSKRTDVHEAAKNKMINEGRLYSCYESMEELEIKKKTALSRNLPPIYDRSSLKLTSEQKAEFAAKGINPHWRFLMNESQIEWEDGIKGHIHFDPKHISDPVLIRADGTMTYMIASVADDIDLNITHIIRGEDHITNSAVHVQMFEALGSKAPNLSHLALIQSKTGEISKRIGGFDIASLRQSGLHPMAINSFLAKLGSSASIEYRKTLDELIREFSITNFSKSPTNYDIVELERINTKLTHSLSYQEASSMMPKDITEEFWNKVRPNLETVSDIKDWWVICCQDLDPKNPNVDFTKEAANHLPEGSLDENSWNTWISAVKTATGKNGKDLFMPIRIALTGMDHGPELKNLLPILGREKVIKRLQGLKA